MEGSGRTKKWPATCPQPLFYACGQNSPKYVEIMSACHQRAADALVAGAIRNGGLYVKLGQGLCSFNHLLPTEYIQTLRVLEDKALTRGFREVSPAHGKEERGKWGVPHQSRSDPLVHILARWTSCSLKTSRHSLKNSSRSLTMSRWLLQAWLRCTVPSYMTALLWL